MSEVTTMATYHIYANQDKQYAIDKITALDCSKKNWNVKVERLTRSLEQNNLFHMWMAEISKGYALATGEYIKPAVFKEFFKQQFLGNESYAINKKHFTRTRQTRSLPKDAMCELLNNVQYYVGSEMSEYDIQLTQPEWR